MQAKKWWEVKKVIHKAARRMCWDFDTFVDIGNNCWLGGFGRRLALTKRLFKDQSGRNFVPAFGTAAAPAAA